MTTVSTPASSNGRARIRPVRWRRLAWVSWRQYRLSAVGTAAFLGVLALYLLIMGLRIHGAFAAAAACSPSANCRALVNLASTSPPAGTGLSSSSRAAGFSRSPCS